MIGDRGKKYVVCCVVFVIWTRQSLRIAALIIIEGRTGDVHLSFKPSPCFFMIILQPLEWKHGLLQITLLTGCQ